MGMNHECVSADDCEMRCRQMLPPSKKQDIAGLRIVTIYFVKVPGGGTPQAFVLARKRPDRRVRRYRFRLITKQFPPYATNKTEAVATDPHQGALVRIGRADPATRSRNNSRPRDIH